MDSSIEGIINRLQTFMNQMGMSPSQFADKCDIPRSTLSQLFGGRTRSINDTLLSKLATAFPNLNILWLLFGRGSMLTDSNIEFSEPLNQSTLPFGLNESSDSKNIKQPQPTQIDIPENSESGNSAPQSADSSSEEPEAPYGNRYRCTLVASQPAPKEIIRLIVLYSDGSFDDYRPGSAKNSVE
ncbi:MAG: helix-turn-helix domain-containing protein [Muribaculum sp.]|nr:helix-turn-helix domain-containing protein [Muribaculaceae bacterium]MCM1081781.1 helix-turn-helix domain-containing protein [Muribaculum sp.]